MNGNIASDDNRQITNIDYNILDKPEQVVIDGKGTVSYVYDADGNKLQKKMLPEGGGTETVTSYVSGFVYRGTELQYILFEEGRIRVMESVSENNGFDYLDIDGNLALPNNKRGAWDYFVRDQLSNTRMVLTQETYMGSNICTFEQARLTNEAPVFGQTDANGQPTSANEVTATRLPSTNAAGWTNPAIGSYVSRIWANNGKKLGANALLKVMAGDKVSAYTNYYYPSDVTNNNFVSILHNLLPALTAAIGGSPMVSGNVKDASSAVIDGLSASNNPLFESTVSPGQANTTDPRPRAFLTVVFFDERFNFVEEGSISLRVDHAGYIAGQDYLSLTDIKAPKNGYAYAFVSNESYTAVFFDNFRVTHEHGRILEENHYYAYGLRNAAISSRAYGAPGNEYGYQGEYNEFDDDIGWNDFDLRSYDAQIGRFLQQDPYGQFASGYMGMGGDPINKIDEDGGWSGGFTGAIVGGVIGGVGGYLLANKLAAKPGIALLAGMGGAIVGAGLGYAAFESGFNADAGNFGMELRSFYDGLFAGGGHMINHGYSATNSFNSAAHVISPNLSIKLFSTKDIIKIGYEVTREFYLSTQAVQQPGDNLFQRSSKTYYIPPGQQGEAGTSSLGGIGSNIYDIGSVPPIDPASGEVKSKWTNSGTTFQTLHGYPFDAMAYGVQPPKMGFDPSTGIFNVTQLVSNVSDINNITGSRGTYDVRPQETRVKINYYRRVNKYFQKKKFLFFTIRKYSLR